MITVKEADFFLWGGASHTYIYIRYYIHISISIVIFEESAFLGD